MKSVHLKTRFCPSPTGLLHVGNIRTALFNALLAKGQNGVFLLRIEDTDKVRSETQYTESLQKDMQWLGLQWDEGPGCEKEGGPYYQSERQDIYDRYYKVLEDADLAYPCFCSEAQLMLARKVQMAAGKPPRYAGTCRSLTHDEIQAKEAQGLKAALRFKIPSNEETIFHDWVRGEQKFQNNDIGDFIIRRSDGTPPFMYCNAIDDALMGVTHALRGEDHLTNTPRQIMILKALNLPIPQYGHISLIVGASGAPLSKREGSRSMQSLREEGYLPMAVVNYLARLGHHYPQENWMNLEELATHFSLKSLGSAPARFDINQLLHWQRESILHLTPEALWEWMGESVHNIVPENHTTLFRETIRSNVTFPADAKKWANCFYNSTLETEAQEKAILLEAGAIFFKTALQAVQQHGAQFESIVEHLKLHLTLKGKALFQPLRIALTGRLDGPELKQICLLLGEKEITMRLEKVLNEIFKA